MNNVSADIIKHLIIKKFKNQRSLAEHLGYSVGKINISLKELKKNGYINGTNSLTNYAIDLIKDSSPKNAIILAAGFGMRMVPINTEVPKGLLEVKGETLIERIIKQLHEVNIHEIYVVVGFMKEQYEYLIDEYNVKLIFNPHYVTKNNLHSLNVVRKYLSNTYIIPCDIWCKFNPFHQYELNSWYMVNEHLVKDSNIKINRKMELVSVADEEKGNAMIGVSYLNANESKKVKQSLEILSSKSEFDHAFWETTLFEKNKMIVQPCLVDASDVIEINTYEQLRELDSDSNQLKTDAIQTIEEMFKVSSESIKNIQVLKKGMTNRSFLFECNEKKYIMRIPGEGTDKMINRKQETAVYDVIKAQSICDEIVYINPNNGYKITEYIQNARVCNPFDDVDLHQCMAKLKEFHQMELSVNHRFDIFKQTEYYESLWCGAKSIYRDYEKTKNNVFSLKSFIDSCEIKEVLTHIDAVPDNFLFSEDGQIRLIDWEYAGMQDPHVDIAMFCIYALYDKEQVDHLIDIYFNNQCSIKNRLKIYCYIASCGLLWSNWCEYKRMLGVEFGEYSLAQYRYAKDYYQYVKEALKGEKN